MRNGVEHAFYKFDDNWVILLLKRNISSKKSIRHKDICYVCEGDKVTITANKSGLIIKASGIALSDGNIGSTVRVENSRTQRIVVGTVYALKEVQVTF